MKVGTKLYCNNNLFGYKIGEIITIIKVKYDKYGNSYYELKNSDKYNGITQFFSEDPNFKKNFISLKELRKLKLKKLNEDKQKM